MQYFTRFQLTARLRGPSATAGLLVLNGCSSRTNQSCLIFGPPCSIIPPIMVCSSKVANTTCDKATRVGQLSHIEQLCGAFFVKFQFCPHNWSVWSGRKSDWSCLVGSRKCGCLDNSAMNIVNNRCTQCLLRLNTDKSKTVSYYLRISWIPLSYCEWK